MALLVACRPAPSHADAFARRSRRTSRSCSRACGPSAPRRSRRCAPGPRWRRFRSSFERGIMWLTLIGSPVSGSAIRQSSGYSCWRSNTAAIDVRRAGQRRVVGDVVDPFVADPDVRPAGGQRLQELFSGPRPHGQSSLRIARSSRQRRDRRDRRPGQFVARIDQVSIVNRQYGRRITGMATLRTGTPPGVVPHSMPRCAWPWSARSAPVRSIASASRWLPRNG